MILAIKRAVIVILGVLLQFGFEIITVLLFSEYIAISSDKCINSASNN